MAVPRSESAIQDIARHRAPVLAQTWARGLDPSEVSEFLASLPTRRFPAHAYAHRDGVPLIQPRGGVPRYARQRRLTRILCDAGSDFIPLTIDSYTRHNQYDTANELLMRSEQEEKDYLNGYPLPCHGHELTRELYAGLERPVSLRHGTPDARLLVEIAIASGIVEIEGGGLCYCLPYSEGFPLDRALLYWQYVDRVCALYSRPDRPVHRESFGPLTATLVPPCIVIAVQVLEGLLAAEQGVVSYAASFGQTGAVAQDIATAHVLRSLLEEYLRETGFASVRSYLVYHQWMGQFPANRADAAALIANSALIAKVIDADKVVVKTVDEAYGVPQAETNADAVRTVRYVFRTVTGTLGFDSDSVRLERELIEAEARSILDCVLSMPGDALWQSVYRAFQLGVLDVPFSPHADNPNRLISIRDHNGAIRIKDPGAVPVPVTALARERELLRVKLTSGTETYRHLLADINLMA